ncbi:MAG: DHH family protein, partial [Clostridia bacterium]|nr:DHH family protein [Clostridia bacterium]
MIVVTSGSRYIDIDAYASCMAYRELLKLKGIPAKAISTAKINESITKSLSQFDAKLDKLENNSEDEYIVIDVSNQEYFDKIIKQDRIIEIIDHHTGFESYWGEKLGEKADIEFIGAVATKIVERYEQENLLDKMNQEIAYLLMAAILDNTLNFKAKVTTLRDKNAYQKLEKITGNDSNYGEKYFLECQEDMEKNLVQAIQNDTKLEQVNEIIPYVFGQLTVWDKKNILENKNTISQTLCAFGKEWMMNLICLKDEKSYILAQNQ